MLLYCCILGSSKFSSLGLLKVELERWGVFYAVLAILELILTLLVVGMAFMEEYSRSFLDSYPYCELR